MNICWFSCMFLGIGLVLMLVTWSWSSWMGVTCVAFVLWGGISTLWLVKNFGGFFMLLLVFVFSLDFIGCLVFIVKKGWRSILEIVKLCLLRM